MGQAVARRKKAGKTGADSDWRSIAITIKGSAEWKAWVEAAAEHQRTTVAEFLDRAAVAYARQIGFDQEAPKR